MWSTTVPGARVYLAAACLLITVMAGWLQAAPAGDVEAPDSKSMLIIYGHTTVVTAGGHGPDGFIVEVTNLRSYEYVTAEIGAQESGLFEAVFVNLNNDPVALEGDTLSFKILGSVVLTPGNYVLTDADITSGIAECDLWCTVGVPDVTTSFLAPCFPNPFNPTTTVRYRVGQEGPVRLRLFDLSGRLVKTLADDVHVEGDYDLLWNGRDDDGNCVASGVYLVRMEDTDGIRTRKLTLAK